MEAVVKKGLLENFMQTHQNSIRSLFQRKKKSSTNEEDSLVDSPGPIPQLSVIANSVVARCSKILKVSTAELQHRFDIELPETVKQLLTYTRNFVEFCSYQALNMVSRNPDYLSDPEFRRLMYDMMLAWEAPCVETEPENKVDDKKTIGPEAFARIAPACPVVADVIIVHNLFDALTSSSSHRLHFLIFDKYLRSLDKVVKVAKNALGLSISNLQLDEGEITLDVDGAVPTQPVLQHVGMSAWPGRLTLTNYALYFGSLGMGSYDKAVREEPVYFEFPEFKGNSRRDYWLDICLEILRAHRFIRKNNFNKIQQSEVLARAVLGIFRYRAIREAFHTCSSQYKTLLAFNLAESLPKGDIILETLSSRLALLSVGGAQHDMTESLHTKQKLKLSPVAILTLGQLGFNSQKESNLGAGVEVVGDICVGETNLLEIAVKKSISDTGRVEAAQATVNQVKVEGIDTNLAVMKELLFHHIAIARHIEHFASWEDPFKSTMFLMLTTLVILRGWIRYVLASISVFLAVCMLWSRLFNRGKPLEPIRIILPPNKNAVEQLLTLQEAISKFEALIQDGNIILLKIRALLFAALPPATDKVALLLVLMAAVFVFVPPRYIILLVYLEAFTRELPYRKESSDKLLRRAREWWFRIPAAPVQLIKNEEKRKKKR
ncbi:hypothetical protein CISIN_1g005440mg [Citrus sinensis]|uniref:Uncharacterized protein n=1 Tax=Citrus sinensis TaxID=2711 RepID=A0A067GBH5_CITSI|nr:hypothetical protein CISIN_1g005440mg [Citrus sinensis]